MSGRLLASLLAAAAAAAFLAGFAAAAGEFDLTAEKIEATPLGAKATGGVVLTHGDARLTADELLYDATEEAVYADGNVHMWVGGVEYTGERATYSVKDGSGRVYDATARVYPWYLFGARAEGSNLDDAARSRLELVDAYATNCDLPHPHWRISARRIVVDPGRRFWAYDARVYVGGVPVLYLPRLSRSLAPRREGWVFTAGHDSEKGYELLSHYNWWGNERIAGRVYLDLLENWGPGVGADVELVPTGDSADGSGLWYAWWMPQDERAYEDAAGLPQTAGEGDEIDRYKLFVRHRQYLRDDLTAILRYDRRSDADFNDDFEWEERWRRFTRDDLEDQNPEASLSLTQRGEDYNLLGLVRGKADSFTEMTEELPAVRFDLAERRFESANVYRDFDLSARRLTPALADGDVTESIASARASAPLALGPLRLEPGVGVGGAWYSKDARDESDRAYGNWSASLGTNLSAWRKFELGDIVLKHSFQPRVTYTYSPSWPDGREWLEPFVTQLPSRESRLALELLNWFDLRKASGETYRAGYLRLYSGYDWAGEHRWEIVGTEVEVSPGGPLTARLEAQYDSPQHTMRRLDSDLFYAREDWGASVGTRFSKLPDEASSRDLVGGTWLPLGSKMTVSFDSRYDLEADLWEKKRLSLLRDLHCWEVALSLEDTRRREGETELAVFVTFFLKGTGARLGPGERRPPAPVDMVEPARLSYPLEASE